MSEQSNADRHAHYRIIELEQELISAKQIISFIKAQVSNAITELQEDDVDEAIDTLQQIL